MRPGDPIAEYGAAIARELRFDAGLARRVRAEAEDHLLEALGRSGESGSRAAELEAIRAFGNPHELACAFAPGALQSLARRAAVVMALAVMVSFAAMVARSAWYGWMLWQANDQLRAASAIGVPADRVAFAISFVFALIALIYTMTRRAPPCLHADFGREIRRGIALGAIAVIALFAAIATEMILTGIRFATSEMNASALIPASLLGLEAMAAAGCTAYLGLSLRRLALTARFAGLD
jgi:hypothetical protein